MFTHWLEINAFCGCSLLHRMILLYPPREAYKSMACWAQLQLWLQKETQYKKRDDAEGVRERLTSMVPCIICICLFCKKTQSYYYDFLKIYQFLHIPDNIMCIYLYIHICVLNFWKLCYTSLHIHMVISGNSQTTHLCRTRGHTWKMIIGRNERRGMWRLSHLQENVENDVQEFSGEQGSPLFGCLCCISGWLLFGTSSHSNDVSSWNVHFLMILSDCFTLGHQTKVLINNLFGLTF